MDLIPVATATQYEDSLRRLFPQGEFWDAQFDDPTSDLSIWCQAKAQELTRFKVRRSVLMTEAVPTTSTELIDSWERNFDLQNPTLTLGQRRTILQTLSFGSITKARLNTLAIAFGASIQTIEYPFVPATFGWTRFSRRMAGPGALNVLYITMTIADVNQKPALEDQLLRVLLGSNVVTFFYGS